MYSVPFILQLNNKNMKMNVSKPIMLLIKKFNLKFPIELELFIFTYHTSYIN